MNRTSGFFVRVVATLLLACLFAFQSDCLKAVEDNQPANTGYEAYFTIKIDPAKCAKKGISPLRMSSKVDEMMGQKVFTLGELMHAKSDGVELNDVASIEVEFRNVPKNRK